MTDKKANVPPAKSFNPSGAPDQAPGIDLKHPSVDANPREGATEDEVRIDFNAPSALVSEEEQVAENLKAGE
jgi:hypothetical protein